MTKQHLQHKHLIYIVLIGAISILTLNSCYKDRLKLDRLTGGVWNPEVAAPLFYGALDMSFVVEKSEDIWKEDPDGLLSLVYFGEQITQVGDKIISIPNQLHDTTLAYILPPTLPVGDSVEENFTLTPEFTTPINQRLDSMLIKSGKMKFDITTDLNHDSYVEIVIPQFTKYGATFKEIIEIPYSGGSSTTVTREVILDDYWLRINNSGSNNEVTEFVKVLIRKGNNPDNSPYSITLSQSIKDIEYYQIFGYFHQYNVDVDLTKIDISLFDNRAIFDATIEEAYLDLKFMNSYGMPIDITFDELYVEKKDGTKMNITSSLLPTISINYPNFNNIGSSDTTSLIFTKDNSNVVDIVNFRPKKLMYSGTSITNPTGNMVPNFVIDTSKISLQANLEIPLYGRGIVYSLQDTMKLNIEDKYNWEELSSIDINLNTVNQFPQTATLQIYLTDTNKVIIDSLFDKIQPLVEAAVPGPPPEYRVTTPVFYSVTAHLTNTKITSLHDAAYMIVSATGSTFDNGNKIIKIYSDYSLDFQISAKAEYKTDY